ncbi:MAG: FKBP-type peptidyl-prolyl cis-trans isomerase [Gammaproteobacteria bacterium]|nr:peptidylprolyl isomerase [Gammaproteobacteria bacterium]
MRRICLMLSAAIWLAACSGGNDGGTARSGAIALPSGELTELTVIDVVVGDGPVIQNGDTAIVHYTGWLYDPTAGNRRGTQFDSSRGGAPFTFQPGARRVIRGWEEGVPGMRVGGRRLLFIPAEYGYGERGTPDGTIPPNAGLVFDVELVDVIPLP